MLATGIASFFGILGISLGSVMKFSGATGGILLASKLLKTKENNKEDKKGFSTLEDIQKLNNENGLKISKNISIAEHLLYEHLLIIGPTGAGKTTGEFLPNLLNEKSLCNGESSVIVTDPKGEIREKTAGYQRKLGRKIKIFSPLNEVDSIHYNPLDFCKDESEVISLARDILSTGAKTMELRTGGSNNKDAIWINMATPLFASILLYAWLKEKPYNNISSALKMMIDNQDTLFNKLAKHENENVRLQYKIFNMTAGSDATMASILTTLTSNAQSFLTPSIQKITAYTDFDFNDLRNEKTILYIIYPPEKACDLAPLMSTFFSQLFQCNKKGKYPLFCLFDELANIGQIPNFATYCSTVRDSKISLICCLQDKTQLKNLYGNTSETIYNNLKNTIIYGGSKDYETLRSVSTLCGNQEVINISTTTTSKGNTTTTKGYKTKSVLGLAEVRTIANDEILIFLQNSKPLLDKQNKYFENYDYLMNSI